MKLLREFNCVVTVMNGDLFVCELDHFGSVPMVAGSLDWRKLNEPPPPGFLQAANEVLKTNFKDEDFQSYTS